MPTYTRVRRPLGALVVACLGALASPASADDVALDQFQPAPAGDRFFGVASPTVVGDPALHLELLGDYAHNPLVAVRKSDGETLSSVVESQLTLHVEGSLALWQRVLVDVDLPIALVQDGSASGAVAAPSGADVGDLRLGLRLRLLGAPRDPFQVAVGGHVWVPTGSGAFTTDGQVRGEPQLIFGGRASRLLWTLAGGLDLRPARDIGATTVSSRVTLGAGAAVLLGEDKRLQIGPEGTASIDVKDVNARTTNGEVLLGVRYRLTRLLEIGAGAGPGLSSGVGTPDVRAVAMIAMSPEPEEAPKDRDRDGIVDASDACPDVPGVADPDPKKNGCPPPPQPADRDHDGIVDASDACPDVPGVADPDPKKNGCPPPPADRDHDGIVDSVDACPDVAGVADADPKKNGCPPDKDGDGIYDTADACVDVPGVADPDPKWNGCPADLDGDGIPNAQDACPREKGKADPDPQKNGCPLVSVGATEVFILEQVQFDTGKATIKPVSNPLLDNVAKVLDEHRELLKLEVQGHTDNKGTPASNRILSQSRADAVRKALVKRGVAADRLTAKGYGQDVPIGDNATDEGRQKNRRVQFKITEKKNP